MSDQQFEGTTVTDYQAKLPSITVDCDYYKAGTILRLAVEVRVKGVGYDEDKEGNWVRQHKLGIQDIEVVSSYDPADANDSVGGSSSGGAPAPGDPGIGVDLQTTADQWPGGVAKTSDGTRVDTETGERLDDDGDDSESTPLDDQIEREVDEASPEGGEQASDREKVEVGF